MKSADMLKQWVVAINTHDVASLVTLMARDFVFVDSLGDCVNGARSMEVGWRNYFAMCPDYWIATDCVMAEGDTLLVIGEAGGTIDCESWRTPAAWKMVIRNNGVAEWRVFADNTPVYEILKKRQRHGHS